MFIVDFLISHVNVLVFLVILYLVHACFSAIRQNDGLSEQLHTHCPGLTSNVQMQHERTNIYKFKNVLKYLCIVEL